MIWLLILIALASLIAILILTDDPPEGWEDQEGFHYGKQPGPWDK